MMGTDKGQESKQEKINGREEQTKNGANKPHTSKNITQNYND